MSGYPSLIRYFISLQYLLLAFPRKLSILPSHPLSASIMINELLNKCKTHPQSNQGCNTRSQDVFTSVSSVNPITVSVAPPRTWLCTFLRSKNQGNQVLSHLVTAAFRFPGMYWAQSRAEPRDPAHGGDALCKMHSEMDKGEKGPKKGKGLFHTSKILKIYSKM